MRKRLRQWIRWPAIAALAGATALVVGVLVFRGPAEVFTATVDSFDWNCETCEHVLSVSRTANYTESWSFKGAMRPGAPPVGYGDQVRIETTPHALIAVTMLNSTATGDRYTTDREFPPPFGPLTGLVGWGCFIAGIALSAIAAWSFVRRQAVGRRLSAQSLVAGLLCLAPGIWFFAERIGRFDAEDYLYLTFLVWVVAAGTAIVLGILALRREHDRIARGMAATGLGLSIVLSVGWPVAFFALLSAEISSAGG